MNPNKLIAHRGDNTHYPENTLIAIETALKAGALAFECDIQMNANHSLVLFHDDNLLRMTGDNKAQIFDVSNAQMEQLSIHEPEQFDQQHYPTVITYFNEVVALLKQYPKVQAYIEIKDESLAYWGVELVMKKLLQSLMGLEQQAFIISFNVLALDYAKAHSNLRVGLVFEEYNSTYKEIADRLKPEFMICDYQILPDEKLWSGDWQWMVYTVDEIDLAKRLLQRGDIDFVETDDIQLLLNA